MDEEQSDTQNVIQLAVDNTPKYEEEPKVESPQEFLAAFQKLSERLDITNLVVCWTADIDHNYDPELEPDEIVENIAGFAYYIPDEGLDRLTVTFKFTITLFHRYLCM